MEYKCPNCIKTFQYESQYQRHRNAGKCYKANKCPNCSKTYSYLKSLNKHIEKCPYRFQAETETDTETKVNSEQKSTLTINKQSSLEEVVCQMKNELEETKKDLNRVKKRPTFVNIENLNANITFISRDLYSELQQSLGSEEALRIINQASRENQPLKLVDKLYLEGRSSDQYPIACKDSFHFRYLDDNRDLVDDKDGSQITRQIVSGVQDAMMLANNRVILQGINCGNTDYLFSEQYDLPKIQTNVLNINQNSVKDELAQRFTNPKHPFFAENIGNIRNIENIK